MVKFEKQYIEGIRTTPSAIYDGFQFAKCEISACFIGSLDKPEDRITVRNVKLTGCKHAGNMVYCAVLENIVVDGLTTSNILFCKGVALKHVALKGKIGRIAIWGDMIRLSDHPELEGLYVKANAEYYQGVDWALDIREANCMELEVLGIPLEKILRDPETQKVIYPEDLVGVDYRGMEFESAITEYFSYSISRSEPILVVAPLANKTMLPRYLRDFEKAKQLGLLRE